MNALRPMSEAERYFMMTPDFKGYW
jgi:hypothetical protein